EEALGADVFEHMVGTEDAGPEMRRWRALASEIQVVLHNHPWNAQRTAAGKPPVNALWLWGGGTLPDHVESPHARLLSDEPLAWALAKAAGVKHEALRAPAGETVDVACDLRSLAPAEVVDRWLPSLLAGLADGTWHSMLLDFADGARYLLSHGQRWRWWRRPLPRLDA
ncbi:MAG TPA: phosphoglycerate mutase, partial [Luteimonas sp.]|nr:phosphoglycerate mutase [Luteimonas sp.]